MSYPRAQTVQQGFLLPRAAKVIPQAGVSSLFTIVGTVRILHIYGMVTTIIAGGANLSKLQFKPTGQTAVDLSGTSDINGQLVGQLASLVGPAATALNIGWGVQDATQDWIVGPGTIDLNCAAAAGTGAYRWTARWLPADVNSFMTIF